MQEKHGLSVHLEIVEDIQLERKDLQILLFQSIRELLFNVVKHAGVDKATVKLSRVDEDYVEIVVSDEGKGFRDAQQIAGDQESATGGFGLFSIRERLFLLGGCLDIDSAPGKGTRVTLIAPSRLSAKAEASLKAAVGLTDGEKQELIAAHRVAGEKISVLLADDHAVMRQGLATLLREEPDIEILGEAGDGQEAVNQARRLHPDVILMDASMPIMDGVEATKVIHAEQPDIHIIGLSMYDQADRAAAMLSAGASAYLTKSGSSESLIAVIREVEGVTAGK